MYGLGFRGVWGVLWCFVCFVCFSESGGVLDGGDLAGFEKWRGCRPGESLVQGWLGAGWFSGVVPSRWPGFGFGSVMCPAQYPLKRARTGLSPTFYCGWGDCIGSGFSCLCVPFSAFLCLGWCLGFVYCLQEKQRVGAGKVLFVANGHSFSSL